MKWAGRNYAVVTAVQKNRPKRTRHRGIVYGTYDKKPGSGSPALCAVTMRRRHHSRQAMLPSGQLYNRYERQPLLPLWIRAHFTHGSFKGVSSMASIIPAGAYAG